MTNVQKKDGRLDILVNNASFSPDSRKGSSHTIPNTRSWKTGARFTRQTRRRGGPDRETRIAAFVADTPLRRFGKPEEVAAVVVMLASDETAYTTGTEIIVDGASDMALLVIVVKKPTRTSARAVGTAGSR